MKFFLNKTGYRSQAHHYNQTNVPVAVNYCMVSGEEGGEGEQIKRTYNKNWSISDYESLK